MEFWIVHFETRTIEILYFHLLFFTFPYEIEILYRAPGHLPPPPQAFVFEACPKPSQGFPRCSLRAVAKWTAKQTEAEFATMNEFDTRQSVTGKLENYIIKDDLKNPITTKGFFIFLHSTSRPAP
jgi:hypothetical protein